MPKLAFESIAKVPALQDLLNLKGKTAIVSGGTYGLGFNVAYRYLEAGANVIISGRNAEKGAEAVAYFKELGYDVDFIACDIAKVEDCQKVVDFAENKYGKVDILANVAGHQRMRYFLDVTEEFYDAQMDINLKGTFFMSQAVARSMVKNGIEGYIVNAGSTAGYGVSCTMGMLSTYAASKGGLNGLTTDLGRELAQYGIRFNTVNCGSMHTSGQDQNGPEMYPIYGAKLANMGKCVTTVPLPVSETPDDMARMFLILSTPFAKFMVGDNIFVDGGLRFCNTLPNVEFSNFAEPYKKAAEEA